MTLVYEKETESIHFSVFPKQDECDTLILNEVEQVREVIAQGLKLRNEKNLKVKQPLSVLYLGKDLEKVSAYNSVIRDELNIKKIIYLDKFESLSHEYPSLNFHTAGRRLKGDLSKVKALCENLTSDEQKKRSER